MSNRSRCASAALHSGVHFDYTAVGHVTIDVLADGSRRPGGSAFYSALQAARLGLRTLILTRGVPSEIEELLAPFAAELALRVISAGATTTLQTSGAGEQRVQRLLAWAGPIDDQIELDTAIAHVAPVARETPASWRGHTRFVGLTPQGLVRTWAREGDEVSLSGEQGASPAPARWDALVLSRSERAACEAMIARTTASGAVAAITAGDGPTTVLSAAGETLTEAVAPLGEARDDLGAGDVFAAAFFAALADRRAPAQAAAFANAAAAVRLAGVGAQAIGGRAAIEARAGTTA